MSPEEDYPTLTPMEQVLGIAGAEDVYGVLNLREQVVVDLLIAGWNQTEIGEVFQRSQWTINQEVRRIRFKLANTKLRLIAESRMLQQDERRPQAKRISEYVSEEQE